MWRSKTFLEIQDLIINSSSFVEAFDLYNGQLEQYRGDTNDMLPLPFPFVLLEFVGGDWEHQNTRRVAKEYFFKLHLVLENYQDSASASPTQEQALEILDRISELADMLDMQSLTFVKNFEFVREEIDTSMTNLIYHKLDFVAYAIDCSLEEATKLDTATITKTEAIAHQKANAAKIAANNATVVVENPFKV